MSGGTRWTMLSLFFASWELEIHICSPGLSDLLWDPHFKRPGFFFFCSSCCNQNSKRAYHVVVFPTTLRSEDRWAKAAKSHSNNRRHLRSRHTATQARVLFKMVNINVARRYSVHQSSVKIQVIQVVTIAKFRPIRGIRFVSISTRGTYL